MARSRRVAQPPTTRLILIRHAQAEPRASWTGPDDRRPLSSAGRAQADAIARRLADLGLADDRILTSPSARAAATAEIIGRTLGLRVELDPRLASVVGLRELDAIVRDAGEPRGTIVVGHASRFRDLFAILCGVDDATPMMVGAFARIDYDPPARPGGGRLAWLTDAGER